MCVCVCVRVRIKQEYMDRRFEMLEEQMAESNESVKTLQEDIQREVCTICYKIFV